MITWHQFEIIFEIFGCTDGTPAPISPRARESQLQPADVETKVYVDVWTGVLKHRLAQNIGPPGHTISIWKFNKLVIHAYRCWRNAGAVSVCGGRMLVCGGRLLEDSDLYPYNSPRIQSWFEMHCVLFDVFGKSESTEENGLWMQVSLFTWWIV